MFIRKKLSLLYFCGGLEIAMNETQMPTLYLSHLVEPASKGHDIWRRAMLLLLVPATARQLLKTHNKGNCHHVQRQKALKMLGDCTFLYFTELLLGRRGGIGKAIIGENGG